MRETSGRSRDTYTHIHMYTHYSPVALYTHAELRNASCLKFNTCHEECSYAGDVYIVRRANSECVCMFVCSRVCVVVCLCLCPFPRSSSGPFPDRVPDLPPDPPAEPSWTLPGSSTRSFPPHQSLPGSSSGSSPGSPTPSASPCSHD